MEIRGFKFLSWSVDAVKRRLSKLNTSDPAARIVLAEVLTAELRRYRPRKRLTSWLCQRIAEVRP